MRATSSAGFSFVFADKKSDKVRKIAFWAICTCNAKKLIIKLPPKPSNELVNAVVMPDSGLATPTWTDAKTDSSAKFSEEIISANPLTVKIKPQNVPSNPKNIKVFVI